MFIQMYLTVSIGPSQMESPTELFIKKFFFRWSPHFSVLEPPNKNPPNRYMSFQWPTTFPPSLETSPEDTRTQSLITNFISFNPPEYQSNHHKQDLLITAAQARFFIACSNFKLKNHKIFTLGQSEHQQNHQQPNHNGVQDTRTNPPTRQTGQTRVKFTHEGWLLLRCSSHALKCSRSNLHLCQNLIVMSSIIHKVGYCLANVLFLKNVWLSLSTCYCKLMCVVVFPHFIMVSKNYAQPRDAPDGRIQP